MYFPINSSSRSLHIKLEVFWAWVWIQNFVQKRNIFKYTWDFDKRVKRKVLYRVGLTYIKTDSPHQNSEGSLPLGQSKSAVLRLLVKWPIFSQEFLYPNMVNTIVYLSLPALSFPGVKRRCHDAALGKATPKKIEAIPIQFNS